MTWIEQMSPSHLPSIDAFIKEICDLDMPRPHVVRLLLFVLLTAAVYSLFILARPRPPLPKHGFFEVGAIYDRFLDWPVGSDVGEHDYDVLPPRAHQALRALPPIEGKRLGNVTDEQVNVTYPHWRTRPIPTTADLLAMRRLSFSPISIVRVCGITGSAAIRKRRDSLGVIWPVYAPWIGCLGVITDVYWG
ncbi:hypothetical protein LTR53_004610 [Teratosphaeriaceae sp. CCFEE 6253]|nr:hypothetical protein LTR53_004610 [Teratosphaeriaceae sp. CCFEE 6253]